MGDRLKVHVFLGAPRHPILPPQSIQPDCGQWMTVNLAGQKGSLEAKCVKPDECVSLEKCKEATDTSTTSDGRTTGDANDANRPTSISRSNACSPNEATDANSLYHLMDASRTTHTTCTVNDANDNNANTVAVCPKKRTLSCEQQPGCVELLEHLEDSDARSPVSADTEYLSVWTLSQSLLLKGMLGTQGDQEAVEPPQTLVSPSTSPPSASLGVHQSPGEGQSSQYQIRRLEKRGVVMEATPDGLLCSQNSDVGLYPGPSETSSSTTTVTTSPLLTPPLLPLPKRSRPSPPTIHQESGVPLPPPTTLLARCTDTGVPYSILAAVVYPCHLKEVKVKSGVWAGSTVPIATVVVTDQSHVQTKVVLWRTAAFWALTVYPGDVVLITDVMVNKDKWRGETVLQSTYRSQMLNLGHRTDDQLPPAPTRVNRHTLHALCCHLQEKLPLLANLPAHTPQHPNAIPYARLGILKPDKLVHAVLRVTYINTVTGWREDVGSLSRVGGVQNARLSVEQGGQRGELVLWGAAMTWMHRIQRNKDAVWDFHMLLVKQSVAPDLLELHSTPWSSCEPLFPGDRMAMEFCSRTRTATGTAPVSFEIDLQTLLSQKYTGDVELKCLITGFQFQNSPSQSAAPLLTRDTPPGQVLEALSGDITFTGCGRCGGELTPDENGIYRPCYPCLPHTGIRHYYRPAVLMAKDGDSEVCVQVPTVLVQKLLKNIPPEKLYKTVEASSDVRFVQLVSEALHALLNSQTLTLSIHSHFLCDENSIPIAQDFLLLDFTAQP